MSAQTAHIMFNRSRNITINGGTFTMHTHVERNGPKCSNSLLHLLRISASGAGYDSQEHKRCPRGPETTIALDAIDEWMYSEVEALKPILWLQSPSSTFTSSIAQHLSKQSTKRGELVASFFFNPARERCGSIHHLIPTIAFQLSQSIPDFASGLAKAMEDDPLITTWSIHTQVERLILQPLKGITAKGPFIVVMDALGKCKGEDDQREVLVQVLRIASIPRSPLRFVITSSFAPQAVLGNYEINNRVMHTFLPSPAMAPRHHELATATSQISNDVIQEFFFF